MIGGSRGSDNNVHAFRWTSAGIQAIDSTGSAFTAAVGVSADGSVVVGTADDHAFRWANGAFSDLGTLGGLYSFANGVSADGLVVVGASYTAADEQHAFRWANGLMSDIQSISADHSRATGVSATGSVVIGIVSLSSGDDNAFRWTSTSGMVPLGTLPGGNSSSPSGVSADGQVVVGDSNDSSGNYQAFRWTTSTSMLGLGTLGGDYSSAQGVSRDGNVVFGGAETSNHDVHAFRWSNNVMSDLGVLGSGTYSWANAASSDGGVIVGQSEVNSSGGWHAFRWSQATGPNMKDLNDLLIAAGVNMQNVTLLSAVGISGNGQYITGDGDFNGNRLAYIVRYCDGECPSGVTTAGGLQQSVASLVSTTTALMAQQHGLAAPLLGDDKPITNKNHVGAFGYAGSASGGGFAQFANDAGLALLMGVSYAQEDIDSAAMTDNVMVAGAVRYVLPTQKIWRPFVEVGGWIAPNADLDFDRTYMNGADTATGKGTTQGDVSYLFGRAGVLFDFAPRHQLLVSGEIGKERLDTNGYAEPTTGNPFNATFGAANDQMDIAKVRVIYNVGITEKVDAAVWAAGDFAFDRDIGVSANIAGGGLFTASAQNGTSWAEFGARVGYALTESVTLDVFANGVAGDPQDIQTRVHSGADLRYQF
ncbi:MAG: hypothetical protein JSR78_16205 [Proteobacteria bacterium]|nr:hypothetical protein [Pseudomonadota bacterium]